MVMGGWVRADFCCGMVGSWQARNGEVAGKIGEGMISAVGSGCPIRDSGRRW